MEIYPPLLKILHALNVEKHLTAKQITEILYPNEGDRAYQRIAKNLLSLKTKNLLSSKSYGLGKEYFWSLRKHAINTELGLEPPRADVHSFKFEHEKTCADVFVALYHTGSLHGWGQQRISKRIIPDRIFYLGDDLYYLEVEMGNQKDAIIQKKVQEYKQYFKETGQKFQVRFVTADKKTFEMLSRVLENETYHYQPYMLQNLQEASKQYAADALDHDNSNSNSDSNTPSESSEPQNDLNN